MNALNLMQKHYKDLEENTKNTPYRLERATARLTISSDMVLMSREKFVNLHAEKHCKTLQMKDDISSVLESASEISVEELVMKIKNIISEK